MTILLHAILSIYVLWLFYLAVMNLKRAKDNGTIQRTALWLGYPILLIGLALDWLVNFVVMTPVFMDLPQSPGELVTGRLKRYVKEEEFTWRASFARWFAVHILDPFDPSGKHI